MQFFKQITYSLSGRSQELETLRQINAKGCCLYGIFASVSLATM